MVTKGHVASGIHMGKMKDTYILEYLQLVLCCGGQRPTGSIAPLSL